MTTRKLAGKAKANRPHPVLADPGQDEPFATFEEWESNNDRRAYADL